MDNESVSVTKRISLNDLGLTGSHQSGIVVPKGAGGAILSFFPKLDVTATNPSCPVSVKDSESGRYWDLRFIYYNGKLWGTSSRNEYRLSGTTKMLRAMGVQPGDYLIFTRSRNGEILVSVKRGEDSTSQALSSESGTMTKRGGWKILDEGQ